VPTRLHEVLVAMFRDQPALAVDVLSDVLGIELPGYSKAQVTSGDLTDVAPTEYRADAVVTLSDDSGLVLAVVVEAQLRIDPRKRQTWPVYVATLHARLGCPIILLIVCPKAAVATWCSEPIVLGTPGLTLTPVVFGPQDVPVVTDLDEAQRHPELAVLSAMTHGAHHGEPVFYALLAALDVLGPEHADLYADLVLAALPTAARKLLEVCMTATTHRYQSDFARRYYGQGEAHAVVTVLETRGIEVPADVRERIAACTDLDQLTTWVRRAVTVRTAQDLFAESP
jgi:hypothetical protein